MPMCQTKTKFGTEALAQKVASEPLRSGKKKPQLYTYKCPACGCYHLSRSPSRIVVRP